MSCVPAGFAWLNNRGGPRRREPDDRPGPPEPPSTPPRLITFRGGPLHGRTITMLPMSHTEYIWRGAGPSEVRYERTSEFEFRMVP